MANLQGAGTTIFWVISLTVALVLAALLLWSVRGRFRAEALATESQSVTNRLAAVLNATHASVLGLSRDGRVVLANLGGRSLMGDTPMVLPLTWPERLTFLDPQSLEPLAPEAHPIHRAAAGEAFQGVLIALSDARHSDRRIMRASSAPVLEDGALGLAAVLLLEDVTEEEAARLRREQAEKLDALGGLTGGIAHDFNNLLAAVKYAIQMADAADAPEKVAEYRALALKSVARGGVMTGRLLAFAKRHPAVATARAVEEVLQSFEGVARPLIEDHIALEISVDEEGLHVFADSNQLETALLNLVMNARDAILRSGQGHKITVRARPVADIALDPQFRSGASDMYVAKGVSTEQHTDLSRADGRSFRYIELSVSDDGPGMDDATKRQAVNPFFTTEAPHAGKGLGLSVVYGFMQQANGILRISSELGQGTCVRLLLPRGNIEGAREAPVDREPLRTGQGRTALIVEDATDQLRGMVEVVRSLGYMVRTAGTVAEALEMLRTDDPIDILLTDIVLPGGGGGLRLAEAARKLRPGLPVLYMSGYTGVSTPEMERVLAPMVQKPCLPGVLAQSLETALKRGEKATAARQTPEKTTIS